MHNSSSILLVHPFLVIVICSVVCVSGVQAQQFVLKTQEAGLVAGWQGNGVSVADYDLDGDLDIYFVSRLPSDPLNPRSWSRLYRNNGNGTYTDVAKEAGVRLEFHESGPLGDFGNKYGASWGGYDNDGDPDLFLSNRGPDYLFRNNGNGTFTDVTNVAGLHYSDSPTNPDENTGALWWDPDTDGDLDLYISAWTGKNRYYRNNGNGTFDDLSRQSGLDLNRWTWMAMPTDINRDGLMDLYLANDFGPNTLLIQQIDGTYTDNTDVYQIGDPGESMGVALGDLNGDNLFELFITDVTSFPRSENTLYRATLDPPYLEISEDLGVFRTGWGWGTEFFDADNDGDLDLFLVNGSIKDRDTSNMLFRNHFVETGELVFEDVSESSGTNGFAESHGLVVFDYDADGDLDILVSNYHEPVYLYQNTSPPKTGFRYV